MATDRISPFRRWIEFIVWFGLVGLFALVGALPIPEPQRTPIVLFIVILAIYVLVLFRIVFPRVNYAPRIIYLTLIVDVLIVGILRLLLAEYLANFELAFIPLIVIAAMVSDRRGVLALVFTMAITDFVTQLRLLALPHESSTLVALLNQALVIGIFGLTGLVVLLLVETIRGRAVEATEAGRSAAETARQHQEEAERTARRWELLNAIGLKIQEESSPVRIFQVVGSELQKLGLICFIALWDKPGERLRLEYVSLTPTLQKYFERLVGLQLGDVRLNIADMPKFQEAIAERRGVFSQPSQEQVQRFLPKASAEIVSRIMRLTGLGSHIGAPLFAMDQVLGVFGLWGRDLDPADVPVMTGLAHQIALALEKARLFEREQKRAAQIVVVNEIAEKAVGLLETEDLYHEVTRLIVERFGYENAAVFINEASTREAVLRAHAGSEINRQEIGYRQSWDVGLIGEAARTGKTIVVNDVRSDPRYHTDNPDQDVCRAEMVLPLKSRGEALGALDVQSTVPNVFEAADVTAMETLASQLATAIEKRELFAAERKRATQLAVVSAIAERITAILDPDQLLNEVVVLIRERFGYHLVSALTVDERTNEACLRAISDEYEDVFTKDYRQPLTVGLVGEAARTGMTVTANDAQHDPRFYFPAGRSPRTGSEMCVPLKMGNRVLGVLDIQTSGINGFDASDRAAMETLANQITVALENARLYAQTKNEAEVKAALLRELSHRVKNNLNTIVGLLYLGLDDETIPRHEILNETLARVQSMAVAHTLLAHSAHARVDVLELGRQIMADSIRQLTLPGHNIPFVVKGESFEISAHQAASVALILNELVTNAIKHGGDKPAFELHLGIQRVGGQVRLEFFNQGEYVTEESYLSNRPGGVGLQLIRTLVEKDLGGSFTLSSCHDPSGVLGVISFTPEKE